MSKKIVLTMIVKNEAHVIERCLATTLPVIDSWCIVDTGSTDGTQEKIKSFFEALSIPGELHERKWVDFGTNRSQALELARPLGDYSLMIDADEVLEFENNFNKETFSESLTKDLYNVFAHYGDIRYHRPQLTSTKKRFYYRGVLHEYVACHDDFEPGTYAPGFINRPIQDGARSKTPGKYARDAEVFEKALKGPVDPQDFNRYHFYLAQSYRDSQQWQKAYDAYKKRSELGGWNEEVYYCKFQLGVIGEILKHPLDEVIKCYFEAYQVNPWRAEPLWAASRLCRAYGRFHQAFTFAKEAVRLRHPSGALFVSTHVYEWSALDELATAAFWIGDYEESLRASITLLQGNKYPPDMKTRLEQNVDFIHKRLAGN